MGIRINGFTTPFVGANWEYTKDEKESAYRIIKYMEDRRVIYNPQFLEVPRACVASIHEIREYLTSELQNNSKNMKINNTIEKMRMDCRSFLNKFEGEQFQFNFWNYSFSNVGHYGYHRSYGDKEEFFINRNPEKDYIEELRQRKEETEFVYELAVFRRNILESIEQLSRKYDVEVNGELADMIEHSHY